MSRPAANIQALPAELRPRERLRAQGVSALSSAELLAVVLGTGTVRSTALETATDLVVRFGSLGRLARASVEEVCTVPGIGAAKAQRILAAVEIGRRLLEPGAARVVIRTAADAASAVSASMKGLDREHFRAILLNTKHEVLEVVEVSVGGLASAPVHPREVYTEAVRRSAAAVIVVHNHPSGDAQPSRDDVMITEQLRAAGRLIGIELLDHLIIGDGTYTSLRDLRLGFA